VVREKSNSLHAVVKVEGGPYLDPTFGTYSYELKKYGTYEYFIAANDLDAWGDELNNYCQKAFSNQGMPF
jgi:hypothetical protein